MASRMLGFVRDAVLTRYLGAGPQLDVFKQAMRTGNLIQNLLGEQTLSAAFIPQYSRMLEEGREEEAGRFAGAIFGMLLVVAGGLALVGVLFAVPIVTVFSPGYLQDTAAVAAGTEQVDRFPIAVRLVQILFPMAGLLVLSAWSIGVLNSHRRFLVAYLSPVAWNVAIISSILFVGSRIVDGDPGASSNAVLEQIVIAASVGALIGGALQFLVQLPVVTRVLKGFRLSVSRNVEGVRKSLAAFWPMLAGRGAIQLSAHLDGLIASFLAFGAQGIMGLAMTLYLLPLSLFGLSVAAAELPELSRRGDWGGEASARLGGTVRRSAFFVIPTAVGYVAFGLLIVGAVYGGGRFGRIDSWLMYLVLAAYSLGLPASGVTRQLNTVFYASGNTRVPARVGVERVLLSAAIGGSLAFALDHFSVNELIEAGTVEKRLYMGAVGLALGSGIGSWYEVARIRHRLAGEHRGIELPTAALLRMGMCAVLALAPSAALWYLLRDLVWQRLIAIPVVALYALTYLTVTRLAGVSELAAWLDGLPLRRKK